jgi:hypothetical protein
VRETEESLTSAAGGLVSQWKMALSLGWVPSKADRESTYEHLNAVLPAQLKFDLHVLMVRPTRFRVLPSTWHI